MSITAPERFERELDAAPERVSAEVAAAAEAWGGELDAATGTLLLPLAAGVRSGFARTRIAVAPRGSGSLLSLTVDERFYRVRWNAVAVLALSAVGGLLTVLWPLFPQLLPLLPFGAVIALLGWFLVVSRLVTNSPEQFLDTVADELKAPAGDR